MESVSVMEGAAGWPRVSRASPRPQPGLWSHYGFFHLCCSHQHHPTLPRGLVKCLIWAPLQSTLTSSPLSLSKPQPIEFNSLPSQNLQESKSILLKMWQLGWEAALSTAWQSYHVNLLSLLSYHTVNVSFLSPQTSCNSTSLSHWLQIETLLFLPPNHKTVSTYL